ncbi:MAG: peptidoglycan binding domain-containing protein [Nocardioidaceae bacterium]|nr:peptidoglycan binding domain-containing protein [Nocardioidaceae bacterium]
MRLWPRRTVYMDKLPQTHDLRFAAMFAIGLILLVGGLYGVGYYVAGDRVPGGTSVAGVDIGNLTTGEAKAELVETVQPRLDRLIRLKGTDLKLRLDPRRSGLAFDVDATVGRALDGESWDPRHMLRVVLGGDDVAPVIAVDQEALDRRLGNLARRLLETPEESSVSFASGRPQVTAGHVGAELDTALARERVIAAFTSGSTIARLPMRPLLPQITPTEAADFVTKAAAPAISGPVKITVGQDTVRLSRRFFSRSLTAVVDDTQLKLAIDAASLFRRSRSEIKALPNSPVSASFQFVGGEPSIVPSRSGASITKHEWADSVLRALTRSDSRRAVAQTQIVQPHFTTRDARALRITQQLSSSAVRYAADERDAVVQQAANLNGTVLRAGQRFGFMRNAGLPPSPGGSSVVASASFAAAFYAGMTDFDRAANRSYEERFTPGLDAYVTPARDLGFSNSTPFGVYVRTSTTADFTGGQVSVEIWGSPSLDIQVTSSALYNLIPAGIDVRSGPFCQPTVGADGFEIDVRREMSRGARQQADTVHSSYAPMPTVDCQR